VRTPPGLGALFRQKTGPNAAGAWPGTSLPSTAPSLPAHPSHPDLSVRLRDERTSPCSRRYVRSPPCLAARASPSTYNVLDGGQTFHVLAAPPSPSRWAGLTLPRPTEPFFRPP